MELGDDELVKARDKISEYTLWNPAQLLLSFKATVFESAWKPALAITLLQVSVCVLLDRVDADELRINMDGHSLLLMPLAFLVVFRTSNSYSRQWEGRGLLGALVFHAREVYSKCVCMVPLNEFAESEQFLDKVFRYTVVIVFLIFRDASKHWDEKDAKRKSRITGYMQDAPDTSQDRKVREVLSMYLSAEERDMVGGTKVLVPLLWLRHQVAGAVSIGMLKDVQQMAIEENIAGLHQTWAGMMKIVTTPLPFPFAHLLHILIWCFLVSLTLPLAGKMESGGGRWYSIPITFLITLILVGLCDVGKQLENPFGRDINDFDMERFVTTICNDMKMFAGHRERCSGHSMALGRSPPRSMTSPTSPAYPQPLVSPAGTGLSQPLIDGKHVIQGE